MRILWHSNAPWATSGYGSQTALFAPALKKQGHEVAISGFWGLVGNVLGWEGMPVYPGGFHPFGVDVVGHHAADFKADLLLTLIDAWVMEPERWNGVPWASWTPIDHYPVPPMIAEKLAKCDFPIAMSRFGENAMREMGADPLYLPHAYDPAVYHADAAAGERVREWMGVPSGAPLLGMVAANKGGFPSRKSIDQVLEAFARLLRDDGADAYLYLHMHLGGELGGVDVWKTVRVLGIEDRVKAADQYRNQTGQITGEFMRGVYNALDVLVNPSMGEGFGIPILEAQACGTPVIVGDWTAMSELCWAGWKLDRDSEALPVMTPSSTYMWLPRVDAIQAAMREACALRKPKDLSEVAQAGAVPYTIGHVSETYLRPLMETIEARLSPPKRAVRIVPASAYAPKAEEATA